MYEPANEILTCFTFPPECLIVWLCSGQKQKGYMLLHLQCTDLLFAEHHSSTEENQSTGIFFS